MIRVDIGGSADLIEVASHRHHPKVLGGELDLRVIRVQLPVAHREPPRSPPFGLNAAPNMPLFGDSSFQRWPDLNRQPILGLRVRRPRAPDAIGSVPCATSCAEGERA